MGKIFGVFFREHRSVEKHSLFLMADATHRCENEREHFFVDGSIGFGHISQQNSPIQQENQTCLCSNEKRSICADLRLDNRDELLSQLGISVRNVISDSCLVLAVYEKWGESCVDYLMGDFTFAIWDAASQTVFCGRDHLGIKPFYYYLTDRVFAFASEIDALRVLPFVPSRMNEGRVADFLVSQLESIDFVSTFYKEIYRLPPAHILTVSQKSVCKKQYWQLDPTRTLRLTSNKEYEEYFLEIYRDAISKRMVGDNVASMLSGGIDSSSIVGVARQMYHSEKKDLFPVFSAVSSDTTQCRETQHIQMVLQQGGLRTFMLSAEESVSFSGEIDRVLSSLQEPFDGMVMIIALYLLAKRNGYDVVLDGVDGDIVTSLSPSYPAFLLRRGELRRAFSAVRMQRENYYPNGCSITHILYKNCLIPFVPTALRRFKNWFIGSKELEHLYETTYIDKDFSRRVDLQARLQKLQKWKTTAMWGKGISLRERYIQSVMHPNLTLAVERYQRVASLCGVEPRHPLLDKRVVEFFAGVPLNQKVRDGWSKYLLRKVSERFLPHKVCWRKGFEHLGWSFASRWLATNFSQVEASIQGAPNYFANWLNMAKLLKSVTRYSGGVATEKDEERLLAAFYLIRWLSRQME